MSAARRSRDAAALALALLAACSSPGSSSPAPAPEDPPAAAPAATPEPREELAAKLATWLAGRFDSKAQAKRDASYFEISLAMCPVDAPELGARALYIEQAMVGKAPYRQRLYVVEAIDAASARSRVFELVSPKTAVGTCEREQRSFTRADVTGRDGCDVEMHWRGDRFVGGTQGQRCPSDLNGASYATSEVELREDGLSSWDRGFDDAGAQKWGAEKGPYEFTRRTPLP